MQTNKNVFSPSMTQTYQYKFAHVSIKSKNLVVNTYQYGRCVEIGIKLKSELKILSTYFFFGS